MIVPTLQLFLYEGYDQDSDDTVTKVFHGICLLINIHVWQSNPGGSYRVLSYTEFLYISVATFLFFSLSSIDVEANLKLCMYALTAAISEILFVNTLPIIGKTAEAAKGHNWVW